MFAYAFNAFDIEGKLKWSHMFVGANSLEEAEQILRKKHSDLHSLWNWGVYKMSIGDVKHENSGVTERTHYCFCCGYFCCIQHGEFYYSACKTTEYKGKLYAQIYAGNHTVTPID